jgi:sugar lactone lactonase YvrE
MPGYTATLYARDLWSPDGLAFDPHGVLYVVEERARQVSRVDHEGNVSRVLGHLKTPEGIAFDQAGNLYVVEDTRRGRLLRMTPEGTVSAVARNLRGPEGIVVMSRPDETGSSAPTVYVTESNVQFVHRPRDLRSGITAISPEGERSPVLSHTLRLRERKVAFWSYAGLTAGPDGRLYVTNELSGQRIARQVPLLSEILTFMAKLLTDESIFAVDPVHGTRTLVARGLLVPEGLSFSADGDFPLYVAEENVKKKGRLSRIDRDGQRTTVCSGFGGIEDVIAGPNGDLYVSEDSSGSIVRIVVSQATDYIEGTPPAVPGPEVDPPHSDWLRRLRMLVRPLARQIARRFRSA